MIAGTVLSAMSACRHRLERIEADLSLARNGADVLPALANADAAMSALAVTVGLERRAIALRQRAEKPEGIPS